MSLPRSESSNPGASAVPRLPKKCVIVPVDFSDVAFGALDAAIDKMVDSTSALHALYVLPVLDPAEPGVIPDHDRQLGGKNVTPWTPCAKSWPTRNTRG